VEHAESLPLTAITPENQFATGLRGGMMVEVCIDHEHEYDREGEDMGETTMTMCPPHRAAPETQGGTGRRFARPGACSP
jgi:hypothetical protein